MDNETSVAPTTAAPSATPTATPTVATTHVLLIDDQRMVGEAVRRMLASESDITLHFCQLGADAITQANAIHPAVILQDLVLADVDGLALVQKFRANPVTQKTPLIVLSSREGASLQSKALAAGANEYMVKPTDRNALVARIRHYAKR